MVGVRTEPLFFQDVVPPATSTTHRPQHEEEGDDEDRLSLAFFELANVPFVGYRLDAKWLRRKKKCSLSVAAASIVVKQDVGACGQHTGGIVWETSYLLINFLLSQQSRLGRTLEVGAGCGLLGQVLALSGRTKKVVLTETAQVMDNLLQNLERNKSALHHEKGREELLAVVGRQLDWEHPERDAKFYPNNNDDDLQPHSFDTIVGTDVVFAPSLVEPLLSTLWLMSHDETVVYLCLQVRCPDSHQLLLAKATDYHWMIEDISKDLASIPECAWGLHMECRLLRFSRTQGKNDTMEHSEKKRRKSRTTEKIKKQRQYSS
jgi:predicted nicotinamide N-methyase